jgi:hypothetical protein
MLVPSLAKVSQSYAKPSVWAEESWTDRFFKKPGNAVQTVQNGGGDAETE